MKISSKLSPEDLLSNIQKNVDLEKFYWNFISGDKGRNFLLGKFKGNKFRLHKRISGRNSWLPFFNGKVILTENGSEIIGDFKIHILVKLFMAFWCGGILYGIVPGIIQHHKVGFDDWVGFGMILFLFLIMKFSQWSERDSKVYITEYLKRCSEGIAE